MGTVQESQTTSDHLADASVQFEQVIAAGGESVQDQNPQGRFGHRPARPFWQSSE